MRAEERYEKLNRDRHRLRREMWDKIHALHKEYDAKVVAMEAEFYAKEISGETL